MTTSRDWLNFFDVGPSIQVPIEPGHYLYLHRDTAGNALYAGSTTNPLQRVANHVAGARSRPWFPSVRSIQWWRVGGDSDMWWSERELIEHFEPPFNQVFNPARKKSGARA